MSCRGVGLVGEDLPQRWRDVAGRQQRGGHLVEQGLEQVVVEPVDEDDLGRGVAQAPADAQATEAAADDDDARRPVVSLRAAVGGQVGDGHDVVPSRVMTTLTSSGCGVKASAKRSNGIRRVISRLSQPVSVKRVLRAQGVRKLRAKRVA
jgi:hypothetical protein